MKLVPQIMKIKLFFTAFSAPLPLHYGQRGARIAYIDMDVILSKNKERPPVGCWTKKSPNGKRKELKKIQLKRIEDQFAVGKILLTPNWSLIGN